ncbi:MAG: bifunctional DNA-formamidopyrimidine glycosylase/DNA-(apurinic or apyrimidinic site) lyase [Victivallaceae bacterium]|nr:bifunctional DNA-formamidopyrimidine glycosylase/DNA-(apurinic or apyrimidinic site) lyase [Victivallaceae bacterium]
MPELPEAESIGRALRRALTGKKIVRVEIFSEKMRTSLLPLLTARLEGRTFTGIRRRGRYLIADLDDGRGILMHFGMSGVVRVESADFPRRKHEHVFFYLDNELAFRFECPRRFSLLEVCECNSCDRMPSALAKLGAEPLSADFNGGYLYRKSRNRHTAVKCFLMDNAVVSGIGNIYAAETLFSAKVRPDREAASLTKKECASLAQCAVSILNQAISDGGTTIADFRNVDGSEGKFVQHLQVYGKKGEMCPRCGHPISVIRQGGRSSFFCPECQK